MKQISRRLLNQHYANAGFTLVELLVALVLFSLLCLALVEGLRLGTTAWKQVTSHAELRNHALHMQELMRQMIEEAYPLFKNELQSNRHIEFEGKRHALTLLTTAPMARRIGGRSRVTFAAEQHQNRTDLVFKSISELDASNGAATAKQRLLTDAEVIEFKYFGRIKSDKVARWHDRWISEEHLPKLIKVHVLFPKEDASAWPDFVIRPHIAVDVGCVYDQLTLGCRGR